MIKQGISFLISLNIFLYLKSHLQAGSCYSMSPPTFAGLDIVSLQFSMPVFGHHLEVRREEETSHDRELWCLAKCNTNWNWEDGYTNIGAAEMIITLALKFWIWDKRYISSDMNAKRSSWSERIESLWSIACSFLDRLKSQSPERHKVLLQCRNLCYSEHNS